MVEVRQIIHSLHENIKKMSICIHDEKKREYLKKMADDKKWDNKDVFVIIGWYEYNIEKLLNNNFEYNN